MKTIKIFMAILFIFVLNTSVFTSCNKSSDDDVKTENTTNYKNSYAIWEKDAKFQYNTLLSLLSSSHPSTLLISTARKNLSHAQQQMRSIRLEAAQHGVYIVESKYETV